MESVGNFFTGILGLIYLIAAWRSMTYIQDRMSIGFITSLSNYIIWKIALAFALGWLFIIIVVIHKLATR